MASYHDSMTLLIWNLFVNLATNICHGISVFKCLKRLYWVWVIIFIYITPSIIYIYLGTPPSKFLDAFPEVKKIRLPPKKTPQPSCPPKKQPEPRCQKNERLSQVARKNKNSEHLQVLYIIYYIIQKFAPLHNQPFGF